MRIGCEDQQADRTDRIWNQRQQIIQHTIQARIQTFLRSQELIVERRLLECRER